MPSTKAAGGGIFSGVFQQGRQGTSQGEEDFELRWYLFFQHSAQQKILYLWRQSSSIVPTTPVNTMHPSIISLFAHSIFLICWPHSNCFKG